MLVLAVAAVLLWCCGGLLVIALCWSAARGDGATVVLPDELGAAAGRELAASAA